jgi:hypothetical protein
MFYVLKFRGEKEEVKVLGGEIEFSCILSALFKERQNTTLRYWSQMLPNFILFVIKSNKLYGVDTFNPFRSYVEHRPTV